MVFSALGPASADDPNAILTSICVGNEQKSRPRRQPDRNKPAFAHGMIGIVERERKRIEEHSDCLFEGDSVFPKVPGGLLRIPFVDHGVILPPQRRIVVCFNLPNAPASAARQEMYQFKGIAVARRLHVVS
jgi:hypothetical protein